MIEQVSIMKKFTLQFENLGGSWFVFINNWAVNHAFVSKKRARSYALYHIKNDKKAMWLTAEEQKRFGGENK